MGELACVGGPTLDPNVGATRGNHASSFHTKKPEDDVPFGLAGRGQAVPVLFGSSPPQETDICFAIIRGDPCVPQDEALVLAGPMASAHETRTPFATVAARLRGDGLTSLRQLGSSFYDAAWRFGNNVDA